MNEKESPPGSTAKGSPTSGQATSDLTIELTEEDTHRLNVENPKSLHKRFKLHCLETEQDMKDVVLAYLASHLIELVGR